MGMVTGEIEAKSNKFDKYSILVNGQWYSSKYEIKAEKGDIVEFDDGDKKYARRVKVIGVVGQCNVASTTAPAGISRTPGFPVPIDTKDRSIVRQSSLKSAVEMVTTLRGVIDTPKDWDDLENQMERWAVLTVGVARIFEDYTAGDSDAEEAAAELKG